MALESIAAALLMPPASLVAVALLGLVLGRQRPRLGRAILWGSLLALFVLGLPVTGGALLATLDSGVAPLPAGPPPQAIVILGGDVAPTGNIAPTGANAAGYTLGASTLERVRAGAELYRRVRLPILVSGGTPHSDDMAVAIPMAKSLANDFEVPARWSEARSRDTWENAQMSAAILHGSGIGSVYLVTHGWHMRRAVMAFARTGIAVTPVPVPIERIPLQTVTEFLPSASGWYASAVAIHEWIGCAWYFLRAQYAQW